MADQSINLDTALGFIRSADRDSWHAIAEEVRLGERERDRQAALSFRPGDKVILTAAFGFNRASGHVVNIDRRSARLKILTDLGTGRLQIVSIPGSMVMGCPE